MANQDDLTEQYTYPLLDYLDGGGETALLSAYEFGRDSMAKGLSPLDIATIHQKALRTAIQDAVTPEEVAQTVERAKEFFTECLSPFEMILRGYKEVNATLHQLNESLEQRIGEAHKLEAQCAQMEYRATHDDLTDLPNRILLRDRLQQAILTARRATKPLAVLMMDLDRFKGVNDTMGHHYGDLLLKQIGPRLKTALRESDTIARFGGDEFLVLLPSVDLAVTTQLARKILRVLERPFVLEEKSFRIGASIGIAIFPTHGADAESLIQRADEAMYAAKQTGNGYMVYVAESKPDSSGGLALIEDLRHAIDCGEMVLHYQPKVDLRTRRMIGVEALLRWQHPQHGLIPPDQFIPLVERAGLIRSLTSWVLQTALRQCSGWHRAGINLSVAVNLSAENLQDPQLPDQIGRLLGEVGLQGSSLELEITETSPMEDTAHIMDLITRLSGIGVRFLTDGFGTGGSSVAYLKKFLVNELKIHKSFISDMIIDEKNAMIVQYMVDLAHNLKLKVVADGVENQETWDRLVALGCDAAQGYFIGRPLPADKITRWLTKHPGGIYVLPKNQ
jgi:diguanylate cyclase (GGDEF)-like protein